MTATVCISNISKTTTEGVLLKYFEDKKLPLSVDHGRLLFTKTDRGNQRTTVSFDSEKTFERALSLSRAEKKLNGSTLKFDGDFDGITVLSEGTQVDIVALHGMNGHAFNSWEFRDNDGYSFMWLRDCLPERIPEARIMIYGYNAYLVSDASEGRIRNFAETFLERLREIRGDTNRPLILVGHSLGGLVIKQALIIAKNRADRLYDSILNFVGGVLFIGTPHRGINGIDDVTFIRNFTGVFDPHVDVDIERDLMKEQRKGANCLFDLTNDFKQLIEAKSIDVATLFELKKTKFTNRKTKTAVWIVDEQSAILGVAKERKSSINADHKGLCKFEGPEDNALSSTIHNIKELYKEVVPSVTTLANQPSQLMPEDLDYSAGVTQSRTNLVERNSYPAVKLGKYVYYVCYKDNRDAVAVLASDLNGMVKGRWSKEGIRSVHRIDCKEGQISFVGENDRAVVFPWPELRVV